MIMSCKNKCITPGIKISSKRICFFGHSKEKKSSFKGSSGLYKTLSACVQKVLKKAKKRMICMSNRQTAKQKQCGI